jgi:hypothetical protein
LRASSGGGSLVRLPEGRPAWFHIHRDHRTGRGGVWRCGARWGARGPGRDTRRASTGARGAADTCASVNGVTIGKTELETAIRSIEARNHAPVPAEKRDGCAGACSTISSATPC